MKPHRSVVAMDYEVLIVSQFTLMGYVKRNRVSQVPAFASELYSVQVSTAGLPLGHESSRCQNDVRHSRIISQISLQRRKGIARRIWSHDGCVTRE